MASEAAGNWKKDVFEINLRWLGNYLMQASLCYNLKKYLKFIRLNPVTNKNYKFVFGEQLPNYLNRGFYIYLKPASGHINFCN